MHTCMYAYYNHSIIMNTMFSLVATQRVSLMAPCHSLKSDMRPNTAVLSKNCMAFFGLFANVTCLCLVFPCLRHPGPSCSPLTPIKGSTVVLRKSAENPVSTYPQARIAKNPPKPAPKGAGARNAKTRTRRVPIFKNPQGAGLKGAQLGGKPAPAGCGPLKNPHPQGVARLLP